MDRSCGNEMEGALNALPSRFQPEFINFNEGVWIMKVMKIGDAKPYPANKHFNMVPLRLQGWDATDAKNFWVGLSHFLPGGGAEMDATPLEKVYVVVSGEVTVITKAGEAKLGPMDSVYLEAGEARAVENRTNLTASMLVVMPYPPK